MWESGGQVRLGVFLFGNICAIGERQRTILKSGNSVHTWKLCLRAERGFLSSWSREVSRSRSGSQALSLVLKVRISALASGSGS